LRAVPDVLERIERLRADGEAAIAAASSTDELEHARVEHLGRKAQLPNLLRSVSELPPQERGAVGKAANQARQALEALVAGRRDELAAAELDTRLAADRIDVTLPGSPVTPVGRLHLLTATRREIEDVFLGLGFRVAEGPEIDLVHYNFDALNHSPQHPARQESDTYYLADDVVLRTHTSPMQSRAMEIEPPPLYLVVPGRTFRRDQIDPTHSPQFHQVEGLAVDTDVTLADLKGTLLAFARAIFGEERDVRLRPHFFPFTEPSVEVDVSCFKCSGSGFLRDGSRCNLCRGEGWIEILGAGEVDPNVFEYVRDHGYDPEEVQGFAFGMGIERIAMLKHGVTDLRTFYENDLRLLEQFG
jgi:phenylalanyl-tRNA synthetase alpha chain